MGSRMNQRLRPRLSTHLAITVFAALGCGSPRAATDVGSDEALCRALLTPYEECGLGTPEEVSEAIDECAADFEDVYREDFVVAFDACTEGLGCDERALDSADDHCFPEALLAVDDELDPDTREACVQEQSTEACLAHVRGEPSEREAGVVRTCLEAWATCEAASGEYWGHDLCTTLLALDTERRRDAATCLDRACDEVDDCLRELGAFGF